MFQSNEAAAMLVYQDNPVGIELFSDVKTFFCSNIGHVSENALLFDDLRYSLYESEQTNTFLFYLAQ